MALLGFQKQFIPKIIDGSKRQTIRADRKNRPKVDEVLYFYSGLRTKNCIKVGQAICIDIWITVIDRYAIYLDGLPFEDELDLLVISTADGFESFEEMITWFDKQYGLPFYGITIQWDRFQKYDGPQKMRYKWKQLDMFTDPKELVAGRG